MGQYYWNSWRSFSFRVLDLKFSPYNINLFNGELNKIESSDMFSNNSYNSQVDKENKNPNDITIYNESVFASVSISSQIVDQGD